MSSNFSDELADRYTDHTLDLYRFDSGERVKVIRLLNLLKQDIRERLMLLDTETVTGKWREKRLQKMFDDIEEILRRYYSRLNSMSQESLQELAKVSAVFAGVSVNQAAGVTIMTDYAFTAAFLKALVSDALIEGSPTKEWWGRQATGTLDRFKDQVRMGLAAGDSNAAIVKRIIGSPTGLTKKVIDLKGKEVEVPIYAGGIMDTSARNAESLVRSSVQAVANSARLAVFQANSEFILGLHPLVVLDGNTSLICMGRSEAVWDLNGNPLQGVDYPLPGIPPWHWNCRTILLPILRSWQEIDGLIKVAPNGATQASMDGQIPAGTSWETWLKSKPEAFQLKKLGKTRYELWKQGKLTINDLSDQFNRILTVEDLLKRIAA